MDELGDRGGKFGLVPGFDCSSSRGARVEASRVLGGRLDLGNCLHFFIIV